MKYLSFHIIHAGEPLGTWHNAADSVIDSALVFLNKSFAATWPGYPDTTTGGVYVPIRFVLAKRDPDCKPTNGITRTDGRFILGYPGLGLSIGSQEEKLKKATAWPNTNYYNIWVLRIDGATGFAYFSPSAGIRDGVMIDPSASTQSQAHTPTNNYYPMNSVMDFHCTILSRAGAAWILIV